uniref:Sperm-activating peptide (Gly-3, Ser-5, Ile-9 SAP-I) n=1 Tax=Heterocentrotus mammillatus TaxID=31180 RepID=Q7M4B9_HETMA|nr:sperm-activating peptide I (3-Gly,5-Ser,9-Ile) [Heterocentrotus mammillatus]
GFGLSGGGIG